MPSRVSDDDCTFRGHQACQIVGGEGQCQLSLRSGSMSSGRQCVSHSLTSRFDQRGNASARDHRLPIRLLAGCVRRVAASAHVHCCHWCRRMHTRSGNGQVEGVRIVSIRRHSCCRNRHHPCRSGVGKATGHRGTTWRTRIKHQKFRSAIGRWRQERARASVTSFQARSGTSCLRPRRNAAAPEETRTTSGISANSHARRRRRHRRAQLR